jgi:hypothetical protein
MLEYFSIAIQSRLIAEVHNPHPRIIENRAIFAIVQPPQN